MKKKPFLQKLSRQLLGGFATAIILVALLTSLIAYIAIKSDMEIQIQERAKSITHGLEFASEGLIESSAINSGNLLLLERLVQNYATLPAVSEISIVNPKGIVIAHNKTMTIESSDRMYVDIHPSLASFIEQASTKGKELIVRTLINNRPSLVSILPFSNSIFVKQGQTPPSRSHRRGVAIAILDLHALESRMGQNFLLSTLITFGSTALCLFLMGIQIRRLILLPVGRLNRAIAESEESQDFILPPLPDNEIGFLGTKLNSAFEQIKNYKRNEIESAERKYQEIAGRYALATQATKVWVWDWHTEIDALFLDREFFEYFGHVVPPESPCRLEDWTEKIYPEDQENFMTALEEHLRGQTVEFSNEHRYLDDNNNIFWFLSRGRVLHNECGEAIRAIGTTTDITERKKAESELQRTNQELLYLTRLKDEFLANMSHELRTPLNAILGMTEGLQEEIFGPLSAEQINSLQIIERSGTHLLELIDDILDLAKIQSQQTELELVSLEIAPLCRSTLSFVKQQAHKKGLQVTTIIPDDLPPLLADERRIRQVLINLLNNSVKFTPEGGSITLEVKTPLSLSTSSVGESLLSSETEVPEGFIRISIKDTGIGISPENMKKLFQPFVQIDGALNRQYSGTGLGLALVKNIVESHGGKVHLTSELNLGSCFMVDLPYIVSPWVKSETTVRQDDIVLAESTVDDAACSLLLVEDNEANIQTLSIYLIAKGYQLHLARSGMEALEILNIYTPDLILMDIQMPGMDGLETIAEIRRKPASAQIPIIALTALAMEGDKERCLAAGADEYLSKPVKLKDLVAVIERLIHS